MREIYSKPLRVYVALAVLAFAGVYSGLRLPISLFPNSSQPEINININYGSLSEEEFKTNYGALIEGRLRSLSVDGFKIEEIKSEYRDGSADFLSKFEWGTDGNRAKQEVEIAVSGLAASWPEEIRKNYQVYFWRENGGFLAVSFIAPKGLFRKFMNY